MSCFFGGLAPYSYSGLPGGGSNATAIASPTDTTTYVTVTDASGCAGLAVMHVMVKDVRSVINQTRLLFVIKGMTNYFFGWCSCSFCTR